MNPKYGWALAGVSIMVGMGAVLAWRGQPSPHPDPPVALEPRYQTFTQSGSTIHLLTLPRGTPIQPFMAEGLSTVAQIAAQTQAVAVLNAGFFDPVNQQSTARIVLSGKEIARPEANARLMENPQLAPYLPAILNRSEWRLYHCGSQTQMAIAPRFAPPLTGCTLREAMGGGPQLLPKETAQQEGFTAYAQGIRIRDALGSTQPNARTAIALKTDGSVLWVMVAQHPSQPSGMTLGELATFLKSLGARAALNLDGGTSASLYYRGQTFYGKSDERGQPMARPVKSALVLRSGR